MRPNNLAERKKTTALIMNDHDKNRHGWSKPNSGT